jgi:hypothetical protein
MSRARVLYFLMGTAAVMFVSADVIAQFDRDTNTHTATSYVKQWRGHSKFGAATVVLAVGWLMLHFMCDGFPL